MKQNKAILLDIIDGVQLVHPRRSVTILLGLFLEISKANLNDEDLLFVTKKALEKVEEFHRLYI